MYNLSDANQSIFYASPHTISRIVQKRLGKVKLDIQYENQSSDASIQYKKFDTIEIISVNYGIATNLTIDCSPDSYQLYLVITGCSKIKIKDTYENLVPGDGMVLNPGENIKISHTKNCQVIIFKIPRLCIKFSLEEIGLFQHSNPFIFESKSKSIIPSSKLYRVIDDISSYKNTEKTPTSILRIYTKLFYYELSKYFNFEIENRVEKKLFNNENLNKVKNYILDNIYNDINTDDLSNACGISRKTIFNIIRRELNTTPSKFIQRVKVEHAYDAIINSRTALVVTEVALRYGFTNISRFSALYLEMTGEKPSETIKNINKKKVVQ